MIERGDGTRLVGRGNWNHCIGAIGPVGCGKTTLLMRRAVELARTPAYVVAQDANANLPATLKPDNTPTGIVRHDSIDSVRLHLRADGRGIHAVSTLDANQVILFAEQLAQASLKAHGGQRGVPSVVILDEIVAVKDAKPNYLGDVLSDLLLRRRWHHTALLYTTQSPRRCHYALFDQATELYLFRMRGRKDLSRLEEGGVPDEVIAALPTLPDRAYITFRPTDLAKMKSIPVEKSTASK
jgi:hypothetical protein